MQDAIVGVLSQIFQKNEQIRKTYQDLYRGSKYQKALEVGTLGMTIDGLQQTVRELRSNHEHFEKIVKPLGNTQLNVQAKRILDVLTKLEKANTHVASEIRKYNQGDRAADLVEDVGDQVARAMVMCTDLREPLTMAANLAEKKDARSPRVWG